MTSDAFLPAVPVRPDYLKVVRLGGTQRGFQGDAFTVPEAADHVLLNAAIRGPGLASTLYLLLAPISGLGKKQSACMEGARPLHSLHLEVRTKPGLKVPASDYP